VVWPLILIFLGCVFLLQNAGYLPSNFWMGLWRLWPLVLVLVGIELMLAHRVHWLGLAALAALVLMMGAVFTSRGLPVGPLGLNQPSVTDSVVNTDLNGATSAAVTLSYGAGQLNVGPISDPQQAPYLATMTYHGPPELAPVPRYSASGGVGQLDYQTGARGGPFDNRSDGPTPNMELRIAPTIPITSLTVQTGAADAHLDLSRLRVSAVELSIGATQAWVRFPESGATTAHIRSGASTLTLEIPEGVAGQISYHGGLSTLTIDQARFPQVADGLYQSADYTSAQNKIDLTVDTGITTIQVS
jgi:cell wall-active antibiotic response 4TMS protein YvqF